MFAAIVGDIIGSIHEKIPHHVTTRMPGPTDDSFLTCACHQWVHSLDKTKIEAVLESQAVRDEFLQSAVYHLKAWWKKYSAHGFSRGFSAWAANPDYVQIHRDTNGCLMRQSPIIEFCVKHDIDLAHCLKLCEIFASPTHDHPDAYRAVALHATLLFKMLQGATHPHNLLLELHPDKIEPLLHWKSSGKFIWDARQSLAIACSALFHARDFRSTINNCIYIGGDVDTYCAIACPLASAVWPIPADLVGDVCQLLVPFPDITSLMGAVRK